MKIEFDGVRIDGVLWINDGAHWLPLCPKHHLRLEIKHNGLKACRLECGEGEEYTFTREYSKQCRYVRNKVDSKKFQKLRYINLDGEYTPIAEDSSKSDDGQFFVKAILTDSKVGLRMVVYAGERGKEKTQIFIEPDIERLAFDQTNTHPSEVFLKLEGTFDTGNKSSIEKGGG